MYHSNPPRPASPSAQGRQPLHRRRQPVQGLAALPWPGIEDVQPGDDKDLRLQPHQEALAPLHRLQQVLAGKPRLQAHQHLGQALKLLAPGIRGQQFSLAAVAVIGVGPDGRALGQVELGQAARRLHRVLHWAVQGRAHVHIVGQIQEDPHRLSALRLQFVDQGQVVAAGTPGAGLPIDELYRVAWRIGAQLPELGVGRARLGQVVLVSGLPGGCPHLVQPCDAANPGRHRNPDGRSRQRGPVSPDAKGRLGSPRRGGQHQLSSLDKPCPVRQVVGSGTRPGPEDTQVVALHHFHFRRQRVVDEYGPHPAADGHLAFHVQHVTGPADFPWNAALHQHLSRWTRRRRYDHHEQQEHGRGQQRHVAKYQPGGQADQAQGNPRQNRQRVHN